MQRRERKSLEPVIHYGLIASGNRVIKDAEERDRISQDAEGALCVEMEAAGLMNDFRCIVVRGISDYADSHKNDVWHPYAAAAAAGLTKEVLTYIQSVSGISDPYSTFHGGKQMLMMDYSTEEFHKCDHRTLLLPGME